MNREMRKFILAIILVASVFASCEKYQTDKEVNENFKYNYEAFWKLIDEQYCFLAYKNIDWENVYYKMMPVVEEVKTEQEFFNVLEASLDYLTDGHVWMISPFKTYSCQTYLYDQNGEKYPANFNFNNIKDNYLKETFRTKESSIRFGEIERDGKTYAYIYHSSFEKDWTENDYKYIDPIVQAADGIIIDVRNNPGGSGEAGLKLAGNFFKVKTHIGYHALKNGKGHDDFTELKPVHVTPSQTHNWADKKTILLTNRQVYSTANLFTSALKYAPNVTQIGGISGGGGGMPMTHYLPNGWLVVFPGNVLFDVNKQHIESGIEPDIHVDITDEDSDAGKDTILERALEELSK